MSGLFDQITNYSPPLLTAGQVNYKGTWDASANSPALVSPPAAISKGDYYVVSVAGTQFSITFAVGDWIISNGTAWEKVDLTDAVSSVFGRTGAVVGASTDYSSVGLTNTAIGASSPSTGAFTTVTASSTIAATGAVTGSNLSGTNTGDQTNITGNAATATALQTPRAINGVNFDGTSAITVTAAGSTLSDTVTIAKGGTGQITAQAALNALLPSQAGASGKNLQSDGTNVSFVADAGGTVTSVSVSTANGVSGTVATSTTTPAISLTLGAITPTSVAASGSVTGSNLSGTNTGDQTISITGDVTAAGSTGVLTASVTKINGTSLAGLTTGLLKNTTTTGVPTIAVSGTDYAPPTSGTAILYGNNAGGFNNVTVGSGLSFSSGTLASTSAGGSVTSVSVTTANGVSGTVTNPSSTPDISLTLGAITPSSVNSVVLSGSATPTLAVTGTSSISGTSSGTNTGDQTITLTGGVTGSGTGSFAATVVTNANLTGAITSVGNATSLGSFSSANLLAALTDETGSGAAVFATSPTLVTPILGTPTSGNLANCTFPTLNQNTTGSAATLTTARAIYGNNFDGSAALTQIIASTYGGTGNGFAKFSGPASSEKTFTLPNASSTLLYEGGALGTPASGTATNLTGTSGITGTGVLNSGSITSGFGSIDVGADSISGGAGAFTTLSASTSATVRSGLTGLVIRDYTAGSLVSLYSTNVTASNTNYSLSFDGVDTYLNGATSARLVAAGTTVASATSTGLAVTGALSSTTGANFATSSGNVGIGTTAPARIFVVSNAAALGYEIDPTASTGTEVEILAYNRATSAYKPIRTYASEHSLMGGNVGIGTTSPAGKLQVTGSSASFIFNTTGTEFYNTNAGTVKIYASNAAGALALSAGGRDAGDLFINSSGNVGIGVTPSAWYSTVRAMQFGTSGSVEGRSNNLSYLAVGTNYYLNSASAANTYVNTAAAAKYEQDLGTHKWYTAASGTAGNAITFTQAMTLDASGQLGIGTSSPAVKLHVQSGSAGATALRLTDAVRGTINIDFPATSQIRFDVGAAEKTLFASGGNTYLTIIDANSGGGVAVTGALSSTGTITSSIATGSRTLQATASVSVAPDAVQNLVTQNYGFFFISEISISGSIAIIAFNASGPFIVWQQGSDYSVTINTASKFNVYYSSGNQLVVQNKKTGTAAFAIINLAGTS